MRGPNNPGIKPHCVPHAVVRVRRGVVAHDEVVALVVTHLVAGDGTREGVDAVVLEAADYAALAEDDLAAGYGDSISCRLLATSCFFSFLFGRTEFGALGESRCRAEV